jgi:transcriptional regulator with XRE-family HTH domain
MVHSGIFLKKIRKKLGLSQQEMADKLGITKQSISKIETGTNDLSKNLIGALVDYYNINPNYLLSGNGEMFQDKEQDINNAIKDKLNLTEDEFKLLKDALHKDKALCLVLFQAINGDTASFDRLKKIIN